MISHQFDLFVTCFEKEYMDSVMEYKYTSTFIKYKYQLKYNGYSFYSINC